MTDYRDSEYLRDARNAAVEDLGPCPATLDSEHRFIDLAAFTEKCEECEAILEYLGRTP